MQLNTHQKHRYSKILLLIICICSCHLVPYGNPEASKTKNFIAPQSIFVTFGFEGFDFIGEGGQGIVYLIQDIFNQLKLAVKIPHVDSTTPTIETVFSAEQAVNTALQEKLNPTLFERIKSYLNFIGSVGTVPFMVVTEFVEGRPLDEYKENYLKNHVKLLNTNQRFEFQEEKAEEIFTSILDNLISLHSRGMVHGDLKSENIKINEKLVPFGEFQQAKLETHLIDYGLTGPIITDSNGLQIGFNYNEWVLNHGIAGTPDKMPPEMLVADSYLYKGKQVYRTEHIDLYALGVMLFEWFEEFSTENYIKDGNKPLFDLDFENLSSQEILNSTYRQKLNIGTALKKAWPRNLPSYWFHFFRKALHENPSMRFQNASEMKQALIETRAKGQKLRQNEKQMFSDYLLSDDMSEDLEDIPWIDADDLIEILPGVVDNSNIAASQMNKISV